MLLTLPRRFALVAGIVARHRFGIRRAAHGHRCGGPDDDRDEGHGQRRLRSRGIGQVCRGAGEDGIKWKAMRSAMPY